MVFMKIKSKKLLMVSVITFALFVIAIVLNYSSFENAKNACIDNNKTPNIQRGFLAMNWAVSCK
ncbi:hypothetical protein [Aneurinibacillus sp. REN35]|uniref:hypothetical protein n=1 Tax=Aneurinibacillus sp. REN35 TaxID=3237286 RepID=UPI003527A22F